MGHANWTAIGAALCAASLLAPAGALAQDCTGQIGDYVWEDVNANGLQDGPDLGIDGARVVLTDSDGNTTESISDAIAGYLFDGLCAGDYTVEVDTSTLAPGLVATESNVGSNDEVDSDGSPAMVTLLTDDDTTFATNLDFGYVMGESECALDLDKRAYPEQLELDPWHWSWPCGNGGLVLYVYKVRNDGPKLYNLHIVDDKLGHVGWIWRLPTGYATYRFRFACLDETTVNHAVVKGTTASGEMCMASDSAVVEVLRKSDTDDDSDWKKYW